ncbi:MAG: COX15/CtaA family protein [Gemmatimonadota bacterium]|nr:COX15/CtaA family protein [Gemmatimonadota bacterium]
MTDHTLDRRTIGRWLGIWAASLFLLILIGGGTRLTESGLSITEWKPVSGVVPPFTEAAWAAEFEKYKLIPQYAQMNASMSLGEFKAIYWWEFLHRFWARFVGLIFVVPLAVRWARKRVPRDLIPRLATLGVLMGLQGAMGWYMVASGLTERVNVSQYRLAAHLSLALVIYLVTVWTADGLLNDNNESAVGGERFAADGIKWRGALMRLLAMAAVTVVSGAFVAGLRAGEIYNEFPMMGAGLVPAEYSTMTPWLKNWFENPAAAQFNHRWLAIATMLTVIIVWFRARPSAIGTMRLRLDLVLGAVAVQVAIGITVLLLGVPVIIGIAHQAGALLVLTALVLAVRQAWRTEGSAGSA